VISAAALLVILLAAVWLFFVSLVCLLQPERAQQGLAAMGSSWPMQLGEHIPRAVVGVALIERAPLSKAPLVMEVGGWFLLASSLVILLLPLRWHNAYAMWWAERIPRGGYRLIALPTLAFAVLLAYITL
jgi:hypothetical protein